MCTLGSHTDGGRGPGWEMRLWGPSGQNRLCSTGRATAGQVDAGAAGRSQAPGPGPCFAISLSSLPVTQDLWGTFQFPTLKYPSLRKSCARAKSGSELLTVGSDQDGDSAGGGETVGTACLHARVNLISVGKRTGWEGLGKRSDVATPVLGAV